MNAPTELFRAGLALRANAAERLPVLKYHRILPARDELFPDETLLPDFTRQMQLLAKAYTVLPLEDALLRLKRGSLPARAVAMTFDDGYREDYELVLPILQRLGLTATFFLPTGYMSGERMWNDTVAEAIRCAEGDVLEAESLGLGRYSITSPMHRAQARKAICAAIKYEEPERRHSLAKAFGELIGKTLPTDLMMTRDQVRALHSAGMDVGAHTVTHPILSRLPLNAARDEIAGSRETLEALIRGRVSLFAYPNGKFGTDFTEEHVGLAKQAGYAGAVTSETGLMSAAASTFEIPRVNLWGRGTWRMRLCLMGH